MARLLRKEMNVETPAGLMLCQLRRSSRRRTIEITVSEEGHLRAAAPTWTPDYEVKAFICERASWIAKRLSEAHSTQIFLNHRDYRNGQEFLFLGRKYPLIIHESLGRKQVRIVFDQEGWVVDVPAGLDAEIRRKRIKDALIKWYRQQAKEIFAPRVFHFVRKMGFEPMRIRVASQKRVWGTCHYHNKTISLNFILVLAPRDIIDYVIVHELAHLKHPNHSKRYWAFVEKIMPDYKHCDDWLNHHRLEMRLP